jgi:hypothetical protein
MPTCVFPFPDWSYNATGLDRRQGNAGKRPERRSRGQDRSGVSWDTPFWGCPRGPKQLQAQRTSGLAQSDKSNPEIAPFLICFVANPVLVYTDPSGFPIPSFSFLLASRAAFERILRARMPYKRRSAGESMLGSTVGDLKKSPEVGEVFSLWEERQTDIQSKRIDSGPVSQDGRRGQSHSEDSIQVRSSPDCSS